ncbi:MAG: calcium/sodium antiporter [Myxococcota bacterium]|nr:calcium/sodium antiporter [Myxococcota bacterium]
MLDLVMLVGGGILLYFGAEWLVGGAAGLARSVGVSALLVGLTVVAYGTSMPEVIVGVSAAYRGHGEIALGNVLGSNIANIALILGTAALVHPTPVSGLLRGREVPVLLVTAMLVPLVLIDGDVQWWEGAALLAGAAGYTLWMLRASRAEMTAAAEAAHVTAEAADTAGAPSTKGSRPRLAALALAGLVVLMIGGQLLVEGATGIARAMGISERIVGLTIVAIGTSLPELATSVIAAVRGHSEIAIGNVVGSNIFNVLLCLGAAGVAGSVGAPIASIALDLAMMVGLTLVAAFLLRTERRITRIEGGVLVTLYVAFLATVVLLPPLG